MPTEKKHSFARLEALSDGIYAIAATLLVLEIKLPEIPENHTHKQVIDALLHVVPSLVAFTVSFLNIIIYWIATDLFSKTVVKQNFMITWLHVISLFWIALIPFPTKFISEFPTEPAALLTFGAVSFFTAAFSNVSLYYLMFRTDCMNPNISLKTRKSTMQKSLVGPLLYLIAMGTVFIHVYITIAIFIIIPIFYFIPTNYKTIMKELNVEDN